MPDLNEAWQRRSAQKNQARVLRGQIDGIIDTIDSMYKIIIDMEEQTRQLITQAAIIEKRACSDWIEAIHTTRGPQTQITWAGNDEDPYSECNLSTGEKFSTVIKASYLTLMAKTGALVEITNGATAII